MKEIIFKCCCDTECEHSIYVPAKDIDYTVKLCTNEKQCKNKQEIIIKPRLYQCWFMHDNHTFVKCVGALEEIKEQLQDLFKKDKYGGWGKLRYEDEKPDVNYIIYDLQYDFKKLDKLILKENT